MIDMRELENRSRELGVPTERLLREELQRLVLRYLSEHRFFKAGVFQGGTALRLCYQGPRFSENLDFVFRERDHPMYQEMDKLLTDLPRFVEQQFPLAQDVELRRQKEGPGLQRFRLRVGWASSRTRIMINLELANQPSVDPVSRILRVEPMDVPLLVESEQEILCDKLVALALRDFIKGRDLWDIAFLTQQRHVALPTPEVLRAKAAGYGADASALERALTRRLEQLPVQGPEVLKAEMARFLPPGLLAAQRDGGGEDTLAAVERVVRSVLSAMKKDA